MGRLILSRVGVSAGFRQPMIALDSSSKSDHVRLVRIVKPPQDAEGRRERSRLVFLCVPLRPAAVWCPKPSAAYRCPVSSQCTARRRLSSAFGHIAGPHFQIYCIIT